jgi:hypothetical protein
MGYWTTTDLATTAGVTVKTICAWIDQGILEATLSEGGHRRLHDSAMQKIHAAALLAQDVRTTAARGDVIGALLKWGELTRKPDMLGYVTGYLQCRLGAGVVVS